MRLVKGSYRGVWFLWPAIIIYPGLGVEFRLLKWQIGIHAGRELGSISVSPELIKPREKREPVKTVFQMMWDDMVSEEQEQSQ